MGLMYVSQISSLSMWYMWDANIVESRVEV